MIQQAKVPTAPKPAWSGQRRHALAPRAPRVGLAQGLCPTDGRRRPMLLCRQGREISSDFRVIVLRETVVTGVKD